ncbi:ArsR/SmtB family transcription factor [Streptomyces sp. NPDC048696]|uniref:ArsR/SmtB family transcription factor n=1 Tax=Streptomyces sp. NPDC048696 TaxID=3365585 RepID=UPI0037223C3E
MAPLSRQELAASTLADPLGVRVAAVSQHLAQLRTLGLVPPRREGTRIYYRMGPAGVRRLLADVRRLTDARENDDHEALGPASSGT